MTDAVELGAVSIGAQANIGSQDPPQVAVFGIRHHGPGSARAVLRALDDFRPDTVLIEGPADADDILGYARSTGMIPPVALLAYDVAAPRRAAFWPFAVFSPEWQALTWALRQAIPVQMCDLPSSAVLAARSGSPDNADDGGESESAGGLPRPGVRADPIATLAGAAGYDDPERWWEDVLEARRHDDPAAPGPFAAVAEAMAELREQGVGGEANPAAQQHEDRREAFMRQTIRTHISKGAVRLAVICGAWHVPALIGVEDKRGGRPTAAADARTLKGLPKTKTRMTWVPWTSSRLAFDSGYGAGVESPGWYGHLFANPLDPIARWLVGVARRLRDEGLSVSSAHVIEAVRLAETLATMRGRPLAGLAEVTEATLAVLCEGNELALELVRRDLVVGETLGSVPETVPQVPLEADVRATAKRLRLRLEPLIRELVLDLRQANDRSRSRLFHRLVVLGIDWAEPSEDTVRTTGTFRETWSTQWHPELAIDLIEAAVWGTTVESAAIAFLLDKAEQTKDLATLTAAVRSALLAELPDALRALLPLLAERAAVDVDVQQLMRALPALVEAARYGTVRGSDTSDIARAADELLVRICVALPGALGGLDQDGAAAVKKALDAVHAAVLLQSNNSEDGRADRDRWLATLELAVGRRDLPGLLGGRLVRLLFDTGRWDVERAARRLHRALSGGEPTTVRADWVEGFAARGGLVLVHDRTLLALIDDWLTGLSADEFTDLMPLLRRTFGDFEPGERRQLGDRVRRRGGPHEPKVTENPYDEAIIAPVLAAALRIMGIEASG